VSELAWVSASASVSVSAWGLASASVSAWGSESESASVSALAAA
jgi:hypothetical protein